MKRYVSIVLIITFVMLFESCKASLSMDESIKVLLDNSNLDYYLLDDNDDNQFVDYYLNPGFGMMTYCDPKEGIAEVGIDVYMNEHPLTCYDFTGYPDVTSDSMITRITTSDPKMLILGIQVGEIYEASLQATLNELGYQLDKQDQYPLLDIYLYTDSNIYLHIRVQNNVISRLTLYVKVTNKNKVVF